MTVMHADLDAWLDQVREEIIEPERPIIDPHHHLWKHRFGHDYLLSELWADIGSGHNIVKTAFMECRAFYYRDAKCTGRCLFVYIQHRAYLSGVTIYQYQ